MSTHNIHFHDKIRKFLSICFIELCKNFLVTQKPVGICHSKQAVDV